MRVLWPVALLVLGLAVFLFVVWLGQRSLLYFPSSRPVPPAASVVPGASDVELVTEDGLHLGAWFVPASGRPTGISVLVCNGNAGDRASRATLARGLASAGYAVLLFDYRGFAGNPGQPTETGLYADARAALRALASRQEVDPARLVYFGESLGAAVAAQLASESPPYALVLRSPFPSLAEAGRVHYPYLPVIDPLLQDRYRATDALADLSAPALVVAGDRDTVVPLALSRHVHDSLRGPKRLVVVAGMEHNDPEIAEGAALVGAIVRFLQDVEAGVLR